jgi:sugar phosphate isomerase/epimerase
VNRRTLLQHTLVHGSAATLAASRTSSLDTAVRRQIELVMKPHGGRSGASAEIAAALQAVRRTNFKIWYDAGNIIYDTDKDPVEELKPIAQHVTGFCAKDCGAPQAR